MSPWPGGSPSGGWQEDSRGVQGQDLRPARRQEGAAPDGERSAVRSLGDLDDGRVLGAVVDGGPATRSVSHRAEEFVHGVGSARRRTVSGARNGAALPSRAEVQVTHLVAGEDEGLPRFQPDGERGRDHEPRDDPARSQLDDIPGDRS